MTAITYAMPAHSALRPLLLLGAVLILGACVTINVYFPAAAAERAADRIIDEVWGREGEAPAPAQPAAPGAAAPATSKAPSAPAPAAVAALAHGLLELLVPAARAQADLDISSPAIQRLERSMKQRHRELAPFFDQGVIGLTGEGLVAVRDATGVALKQRKRVNDLVASENRDRNALYREIARENGRPEWEGDIRKTFARRWVHRAARGWWYETGGGWQQK